MSLLTVVVALVPVVVPWLADRAYYGDHVTEPDGRRWWQ